MLSCLKSPFCLEFVLGLHLHLFPHSPLQHLNGCLFTTKQQRWLTEELCSSG